MHCLPCKVLQQDYYVLRKAFEEVIVILLFSPQQNGSENCMYSYYFNGSDCAGKMLCYYSYFNINEKNRNVYYNKTYSLSISRGGLEDLK